MLLQAPKNNQMIVYRLETDRHSDSQIDDSPHDELFLDSVS